MPKKKKRDQFLAVKMLADDFMVYQHGNAVKIKAFNLILNERQSMQRFIVHSLLEPRLQHILHHPSTFHHTLAAMHFHWENLLPPNENVVIYLLLSSNVIISFPLWDDASPASSHHFFQFSYFKIKVFFNWIAHQHQCGGGGVGCRKSMRWS